MSDFRFVRDDRQETALVFPDTLLFRKLDQRKRQNLATLTLSASFVASPSALASLPNARQIRLTDVQMQLSAPSDGLVSAFDFVRSSPLEGSIVLQCLNDDVDRVLEKLGSDANYFSPRYQGNSEEFFAKTAVAEANFSKAVADSLNEHGSRGDLVRVVELAIQHAKKGMGGPQLANEIVNKLFASSCRIETTTADNEVRLLIELYPSVIRLEKLLETVIQVFGNSSHITVKLEA